MEKYDVSIIVPVYNREEIIKPCIESINSQTYDKSKWEVIFVDDASTDNSIDAIESLIDKNINYRILKRPVGSGNASAPRNEGIKASLGKYVFFLDSDDYVDSQLLENGIAMASKNDSDIVYVKMKAYGRSVPSRPFQNGLVNDASIQENHLVRALNPLKFIRLSLLNKSNILFIQSVDKGEDQIFVMNVLSKAKRVSILADKAYYTALSHEGEHLSQKPISMESFYQTIYLPLNYIYVMDDDKDYVNKQQLYNAWLIRSVERIRDFTRKVNLNNMKFRNMFELTSKYFNIHRELFSLSQIYENERLLTLLFLTGDFDEFHKLSNRSKSLDLIEKNTQERFKNIPTFNRSWIFKNKVVVVDFTIDDNKVAFDFEVNEKKKQMKVWMFSRNRAESLSSLKEQAVKIEGNKLLVFDGKIDQRKEAIDIINEKILQIKNL